ncbi:hypothetical protein MKC54_11030 [[Clostridium] innocuum]|nr:hypothetical protein [[Clostridium] innocuum]MCR0577419.1 hypothetical protein [[Clostridium] innocuum]
MIKENVRNKRFKKAEKLLYLYADCSETCYKKLDKAVKSIQNDKYYPLIEMRFFKKMTYEEIAESMGLAVKTIYKHKRRLVERVADALYADEIIKEILREVSEDV